MDRKKARVIIDEELIARIAQGDNEALTGIYEDKSSKKDTIKEEKE